VTDRVTEAVERLETCRRSITIQNYTGVYVPDLVTVLDALAAERALADRLATDLESYWEHGPEPSSLATWRFHRDR
jgi:hypothetical protein